MPSVANKIFSNNIVSIVLSIKLIVYGPLNSLIYSTLVILRPSLPCRVRCAVYDVLSARFTCRLLVNVIVCWGNHFSSLSCMYFQAEVWLYCLCSTVVGFQSYRVRLRRQFTHCMRFSVHSRFSRVRRVLYVYIPGFILV